MNDCLHFHEFMELQRKLLQAAIDEDKYYLSERAHHDVGLRVATMHFLDNFMESWAADYRDLYCHHICPDRGKCGVTVPKI